MSIVGALVDQSKPEIMEEKVIRFDIEGEYIRATTPPWQKKSDSGARGPQDRQKNGDDAHSEQGCRSHEAKTETQVPGEHTTRMQTEYDATLFQAHTKNLPTNGQFMTSQPLATSSTYLSLGEQTSCFPYIEPSYNHNGQAVIVPTGKTPLMGTNHGEAMYRPAPGHYLATSVYGEPVSAINNNTMQRIAHGPMQLVQQASPSYQPLIYMEHLSVPLCGGFPIPQLYGKRPAIVMGAHPSMGQPYAEGPAFIVCAQPPMQQPCFGGPSIVMGNQPAMGQPYPEGPAFIICAEPLMQQSCPGDPASVMASQPAMQQLNSEGSAHEMESGRPIMDCSPKELVKQEPQTEEPGLLSHSNKETMSKEEENTSNTEWNSHKNSASSKQCELCAVIYKMKGNHGEKTNDKNKIRRKVYNCTYCDFSTKNDQCLRKHVLDNHTFERPLSCPICSYRTVQSWELKKHMLRMHFKEFPCPYTKHDYILDVLQHVKTRRILPKLFSCNYCDYKSDKRNTFYKHTRVHLKKKELY